MPLKNIILMHETKGRSIVIRDVVEHYSPMFKIGHLPDFSPSWECYSLMEIATFWFITFWLGILPITRLY